MKKILAAAAISAMATQAQARCDDVFSAYGPGTDESVELAACFTSALINAGNVITEEELFNTFKACAAEAADAPTQEVQNMNDQDFEEFVSENFHRWTFEHELQCHDEKLSKDPAYDPLSALE